MTLHDDYKTRFSAHLSVIETALDQQLPLNNQPESLWQAMRYGVLSGGKRIRPVLLLETTRALCGNMSMALQPALALELVHCFSLIHDDLPCMDDDDFRRGRPTLHKVYNEAMAVLAGDALLSKAFFWIMHPENSLSESVKCQLALKLAAFSGAEGLVAGQIEDMEAENGQADPEKLRRIHQGKTAALFQYATWAGGLCSGVASAETLLKLEAFGHDLGLAFQIADDLLDSTSTSQTLGKTAGKDASAGKLTYPRVFGIDGSQQILTETLTRLESVLLWLDTKMDCSAFRFLMMFVQEREF
jgi:geranylgeranyl pyrophosphate synthase